MYQAKRRKMEGSLSYLRIYKVQCCDIDPIGKQGSRMLYTELIKSHISFHAKSRNPVIGHDLSKSSLRFVRLYY